MNPHCSDEEFVSLFEELGPAQLAKHLGVTLRAVYFRRRNLERGRGRSIQGPFSAGGIASHRAKYPERQYLACSTGVVLVGSDAHIWPGPASPAMRAFLMMAKELKPRALVLNGDVLDFATISRHPPIGWEKRPTVQDEIEAAQDQLDKLLRATPRSCARLWTLGNHDSRFETMIASKAPELAKVAGVHLKDHFPLWTPAWSVWLNQDVVVKHRFKGGIHATHNNTLWGGKTLLTGHLHSLKVTPFTDYNGTRFGVDTGCLADTYARAFVDYTEDNPRNWRSGFVVLTFRHGRLMWPELCAVVDEDHVEFRGELIKV